jgi:aspartate/methionine/tyrosine aminotransferase
MPIEVESPEQLGYEKIKNNLSESSYTDAFFREIDPGIDLRNLVLCYGSHQGHEGLRELIVKDSGRPGGDAHAATAESLGHTGRPETREQLRSEAHTGQRAQLKSEDVLLTIGAAGALFIIATTLLEKGDELIVVHPNYATNIETPRAIGATLKTIDLRFEEGFELDIDKLKAAITPATKLISVTHPHNPTGACLRESQLLDLATLAEEKGIYILVDETYRDMVFGQHLPLAAEYSPRIISVSSLSKTYGLPGLRTGWVICRDSQLLETFLAAKEQMHICGPVLDEELAYRYLLHSNLHFPRIRTDIAAKFGIVKSWMVQQNEWEWVEPKGGCVCFPRLRQPEKIDLKKFYHLLLENHGTYVGPGHWFEMPDHYMRIGFGWPSLTQLQEGLNALSAAFREAAIS